MTEGINPTSEEYRQLIRRLNEQVLEQATADPQWKQRFLDDPEAATAEFAEARRLREMYESGAAAPTEEAPPEDMPPPPPPSSSSWEEYQQLRRSLWEMVLDRAESDPEWKQLLLDDPELAFQEADFPESQRLERTLQEEAEVSGQQLIGRESHDQFGRYAYCTWHDLGGPTCVWYTQYERPGRMSYTYG